MRNNFTPIPPSFIEGELNRSGLELKKTSSNIMIPCPFHRETHPSLSIAINSDNVPAGCFNCLAGETKVITNLGIVSINKIIDRDIQVVDGHGNWVNTKFKSYGKQKLYKITLEKDTRQKILYATRDHRWFSIHCGYKPIETVTKDLRVGDFLEFQVPKSKLNSISRMRWRIVDVQETDRVEDVYCCNVPTTHSFILDDYILTGNCFGCSETGTWNKLARRLGLRLWNPNEDEIDKFEFVNTNKISIEKELKKDCLKLTEWTDEFHWKRYKARFLNKFGAKLCYDNKYKSNFLYLPITYLSDEYGYCKVRLDPKLQASKYWFSPHMDKVLYPIDYIIDNIKTNCIVLVEGMADAFRLLKNGIPALALLGVVLTPFMEEQLDSLAIENIVLCLDGDEPGQRAMFGYTTDSGKEIIGLGEKLENLGYNVRMLPLPKEKEKLDPDSMPEKFVKCLGKMCQSLGGPAFKH